METETVEIKQNPISNLVGRNLYTMIHFESADHFNWRMVGCYIQEVTENGISVKVTEDVVDKTQRACLIGKTIILPKDQNFGLYYDDFYLQESYIKIIKEIVGLNNKFIGSFLGSKKYKINY